MTKREWISPRPGELVLSGTPMWIKYAPHTIHAGDFVVYQVHKEIARVQTLEGAKITANDRLKELEEMGLGDAL